MVRVSTVLLASALVLSLVAGWLLWRAAGRVESQGEIATASIGGPFRLIDQYRHQRTDRDFRGRFVLLYFGYTYCPDVCPTTLARMGAALTKLGHRSARVVPIFITVDPDRDTPAVLRTYLESFGSGFVGLTGNPREIATVAHSYRVYYAKHPLGNGTYSVDHSSVVYLLDPAGKFVKVYDDGTSPAALAADLRKQM